MKKILIFLFITTLLSCGDKYEPGFNYSLSQLFFIIDNNGHDLLDSHTEGAIDTTKIKIYYLVNGEKIEFSKYHSSKGYILDNQKGYGFYTPQESNENKHVMFVFLNDEISSDNFAYTYIEWNKDKTDTIKSTVERGKHNLSSTMTTYNDSIWSPKENDMIFTIVK